MELPRERVFILNEGAYEKNNAGITFFDPNGKVPMIGALFYTQNDARLGDTGQDIIAYEDNLYVTVYGSQYITKLNAAGVEQARYSFTEAQGAPRYIAADGGKIYVTLYSGNVARLDAQTLAFEGMVKVGNNPDRIIIQGYGAAYDYPVAVFDPTRRPINKSVRVHTSQVMAARSMWFILPPIGVRTLRPTPSTPTMCGRAMSTRLPS